jgi:predicted  nucleic acid-binding Zn-ribbon protein
MFIWANIPLGFHKIRKANMEKKLSKLEEAMTNMLNTQAALGTQMIKLSERQSKSEASFLKQMASLSERQSKSEASFLKQMATISERHVPLSERQTQSEKMIIDILNEHTRILNNLPDAIIEKIGFTR